MKKRILSALTLVAAVAALAGCGGGGGTSVDQYLPQGDPTSVKTIKFFHCLGQEKRRNLDKIVTEFNTAYAGKYKVELVDLAGGYDELHTALKQKIASGEVPALTMGYPDSFAEYITKNLDNSSLLRLDNFINDSTYGFSQAELDDFVKGYYDEGKGYQFSGTWSLPMYKSTEVMYYNVDMFNGFNDENYKKFTNDDTFWDKKDDVKAKKDAYTQDKTAEKKAAYEAAYNDFVSYVKTNNGYTYTVPSKWDDAIELGRTMIANRTREGVTGTFFPIGYDSDANLMITQLKMKGIPYTSNSEESKTDKTKHFLFNNAEAKALVTELTQNINDRILLTKGTLGGTQYTNEYFTAGQIAMTIGSTGGSSYNVSSNFNVGLAPVPYASEDEADKVYIQQGPSICFFDNQDGYIHKGAWLFYKMLSDPQNNCGLALENSYDPVRVSSYELQDYKDWVAKAGQDLKYDIPNITQTLKNNYYTSETFIGSGTARTEIGNIIKYVVSEGKSVDTAFEYAYNKCIAAA